MEESTTRSPICTVLGHVDHGKSSILDSIRSTSIAQAEAGKITQAIGASIIPLHVIKKICGELFNSLKKVSLPGLLFIDTPGHAAFTSLRKRGGSIADIAILVVDINEGFKPQTIEALEILKSSKTPFIIAANKLDLVNGWMEAQGHLIQKINKQSERVNQDVEKKIYEIVGKLAEFGINSERFDRVQDYTKQVAIVPTSAKTGMGIPELLMVLTGLAQRFLEECLQCNICGAGKGTILEVKDEKGLGKTIDVILFDGCLNVGDTIVIGTLHEPIVTRIKALLEPNPLAEMRDKKAKFNHVKHVNAATGVKISAPGLDDAISGMPVIACHPSTVDQVKEEVVKEIEDVLIDNDFDGVLVKADSLGSIEAMIHLLKEHGINIRKAKLGNITKSDLADAGTSQDQLLNAILGFNIKNEFTDTGDVKVITSDIIYKIIEDYEAWVEEQTKKMQEKELDGVTRPCKIMIMRGYVFRQSNPAVFGIDVEGGTLKNGMRMMTVQGKELHYVKGMQKDQKSVDKAVRGDQIALSMENVTVGRQINEGDILYSSISEEEFQTLKEHKKLLEPEEIEVLKEIVKIYRDKNPVWGVG